ncbi:MAG: alpha-L-fucosidase [Bacteroidaceae bacterium]|nr:alpha-L-fucosidase [Bacteroidaceae bacterium]
MKQLGTLFITTMMAAASWAQVASYQVPVSEEQEPMRQGAFEPTWESLRTYQVPEWFRNAKFGIWAHWGAQCVEGSGDWMAREMYMEGHHKYNYHREHYGHQSEYGYKDVLPLFKAENWNAEELVRFYKEECGAEYFFALGNHHDNFDLWDSKYQEWNSKNIGPKRDILAEWAAAAKKAGLPFGVSFHADHAWTWFEPSRRFDMKGKYRGKLYDGWLTKEDGYKKNADGSDKWWKGYDPQKLYAQDHDMSKDTWDNGAIHRQWGWENGACPPSKEFATNFYNRTLDAINRYQPDLIYFDVTVLPFYPVSDAGMKIAAHFYNSTNKAYLAKQEKKGAEVKTTGVLFGKILDDQQKEAMVWDVERGAPNKIMERPWQCCNCLGDWHYNTSVYEKGRYKSAATVVKLLVDIVSKNGNMLLSVPLRADGTFDEKEAAILKEFSAWMKVNKESITGTRPWTVFGEGPIAESTIKINAQGFNDGEYAKATAAEIRFTQTDKHIYATALSWPEDMTVRIKSLAKVKIKNMELLGYGKVKFTQTDEGVTVVLPKKVNNIAPVLKIRSILKKFKE